MYLEEVIDGVRFESDCFECKGKLNREAPVCRLKTIAGWYGT